MSRLDVHTRVWRNGMLERENFPLEELSDYLGQPDCLVWADLCAPDRTLLEQLADELDLDRHAVEDTIAKYERPKAARYSSHLFVTAYAIEHGAEDGVLTTTRVSAFCLRRGLVTVRLSEAFDIAAVVSRWDDNGDLIKFGPRALVHGLLDEIIDGYFDAIESLDDEIETIEDVLFEDNPRVARDMHHRAFTLRKSLVRARRAILPMREVVNTVMRRAMEADPSDPNHNLELAPYYEDLYDHVLRAADWTESLRDMITSIFETNVSLANNRMNLIMKKLTSWAAIIAVPTAITGYFGQNVPYPGSGLTWGFWLSIVSIVLIAFALYVLFRRKDWL
jgi:magnesium transporter